MELPDYLPELAREIAEYIGLDGLMRLVNAYGGTTIRAGRKDIKTVLTQEQYKTFIHTFKNEKLFIPSLKAKQYQLEVAETIRLLDEGLTREQVARKLNVSDRTVYNRQAKHKNTKQNELF